MIAARLQRGDEVRIVSPAVSLGFIPEDQQLTARERLEDLGLRCSFSRNAEVMDRFDSSPVETRVSDLHEAFADSRVRGILTTLGGYNSNGLLGYLDYDLIRANPKIFCGYSDITALATAIHARTGLVTYSGPHFTTFGMKRGIDYTKEYFERCLMREEPFEVLPADHWSDDLWYQDQDNRDFVPNSGYDVMYEGEAEGKLLGGTWEPCACSSAPRICRIWRVPSSSSRTTRRSMPSTSTVSCNLSFTNLASRVCRA
jgi:muramoyltetrapeptide carboxypeptidase LdcA involved in peptidoglycan recycling